MQSRIYQIKENQIKLDLTKLLGKHTRFSRTFDRGGGGVTTGDKSMSSFLSDVVGVDGAEGGPGVRGEMPHCHIRAQ